MEYIDWHSKWKLSSRQVSLKARCFSRRCFQRLIASTVSSSIIIAMVINRSER